MTVSAIFPYHPCSKFIDHQALDFLVLKKPFAKLKVPGRHCEGEAVVSRLQTAFTEHEQRLFPPQKLPSAVVMFRFLVDSHLLVSGFLAFQQ